MSSHQSLQKLKSGLVTNKNKKEKLHLKFERLKVKED